MLDVLPRHRNVTTVKVKMFLMNVHPDKYMCPLGKKSAPLLPKEGTIAISQGVPTAKMMLLP